MNRNVKKWIAEGHRLIEAKDAHNMTLGELTQFIDELEAENNTGITDTIYDSFLFGVAVGARITKSPRRTANK